MEVSVVIECVKRRYLEITSMRLVYHLETNHTLEVSHRLDDLLKHIQEMVLQVLLN